MGRYLVIHGIIKTPRAQAMVSKARQCMLIGDLLDDAVDLFVRGVTRICASHDLREHGTRRLLRPGDNTGFDQRIRHYDARALFIGL